MDGILEPFRGTATTPERICGKREGGMARLRVTTESGTTYVLDLGRQVATRLPASLDVSGPHARSSVLRRDGDEVRLLIPPAVTVGAPMVLWLDIARDGTPSLRVTTPVVDVSPVP